MNRCTASSWQKHNLLRIPTRSPYIKMDKHRTQMSESESFTSLSQLDSKYGYGTRLSHSYWQKHHQYTCWFCCNGPMSMGGVCWHNIVLWHLSNPCSRQRNHEIVNLWRKKSMSKKSPWKSQRCLCIKKTRQFIDWPFNNDLAQVILKLYRTHIGSQNFPKGRSIF